MTPAETQRRERRVRGSMRFHREASTVAELRHPHIVAIHRIGAFRGRHFIAMDYIDGLPLDEWIANFT